MQTLTEKKAYRRAWYQRNKERDKKNIKEWKERNPDKILQYRRRFNEENREKIRAKALKNYRLKQFEVDSFLEEFKKGGENRKG